MSKTKISLSLSFLMLSLTLFPLNATAYKEHASGYKEHASGYKEHAAAPHAPTSEVTALQKIDTQVGAGEEAVVGKTVSVHYTGWLYDASAPDKKGKMFDSSHDRSSTFSFLLGSGRVIKGWDKGVEGMKVGGKRTLIIPPNMAYGAHGAGNVIPPNAALIFDVELIRLH